MIGWNSSAEFETFPRAFSRERMPKLEKHNEVQSNDSNHSEVEADISRVCQVLESIAERFPPESEEWLAIRDAAMAYSLYSSHKGMKKSYEQLKSASGGELTDEMRANLMSHGIDPNDFEDDEADE